MLQKFIMTPREWVLEKDAFGHRWYVSQTFPVIITCPECDQPAWTWQWRGGIRHCPHCAEYAVEHIDGLKLWWDRDELSPEFPPNIQSVHTSLDGGKTWEKVPFCPKCAMKAWAELDKYRKGEEMWRLGIWERGTHIHVIAWRNGRIVPICGWYLPKQPRRREKIPAPPKTLDELNKALFPNA